MQALSNETDLGCNRIAASAFTLDVRTAHQRTLDEFTAEPSFFPVRLEWQPWIQTRVVTTGKKMSLGDAGVGAENQGSTGVRRWTAANQVGERDRP